MCIKLNNEIIELPEKHMTLKSMLKWRNIPEGGTAVAVNGKLSPRANWDTTLLSDNDDVVIISAAFGG